MEPLRRVMQFWNWLPAFRAAAETEHLPTASENIGVSVPALSRAVGLLEKDLGTSLFRRTGRRIELNEAGLQLLTALRDGMRLVHEGLRRIEAGSSLAGPLHVASGGVVTTAHVIPALLELRKSNPDLVPLVVALVNPEVITRRLLQGDLDVSFQSKAIRHRGLKTTHLGQFPRYVYCGAGHPLHGRSEVDLVDVLDHPFVTPPVDANGQADDGWPAQHPRVFGMHVDQMRIGCEVCATGSLLGVFPEPVARSFGDGEVLYRVPVDVVPPADLFAICRQSLALETRAELVVEAVRKTVS